MGRGLFFEIALFVLGCFCGIDGFVGNLDWRQRRLRTLLPVLSCDVNQRNNNGNTTDNDIVSFYGKNHNRTELNKSTPRTGVYRSIEEWHDDTHDPNHVIDHLKRERAKWAKMFEDLGGDGI
ncbi:hypothetical protein IV203_026625 [Nitzschia inconspicua]|uniref:Uncharacterized protein n=1 Tax=Nitzschia inconspicua TaxID=303405 RepID=A0A9K3PXJ3_9STRA|nr:hypothetical protein IV203_026625 [Nitzschia inconspicua]